MIHRLLKPRADDPHAQSLWLTVYADLVTNLMLVFLALFGLMVMGDDAIMKAMESMRLEALEDPQITEIDFAEITEVLVDELKDVPGIIVEIDADATRISFGEAVLFKSGEAKLKSSARPILKTLANYLEILPYTIVVEGHTDNVPMIPGSRFKDNWELSLARSMSVVRMLSQEEKLPSQQLAAAAYGSFRPIESNDSQKGKQLNRRVEVALFKDFPYAL